MSVATAEERSRQNRTAISEGEGAQPARDWLLDMSGGIAEVAGNGAVVTSQIPSSGNYSIITAGFKTNRGTSTGPDLSLGYPPNQPDASGVILSAPDAARVTLYYADTNQLLLSKSDSNWAVVTEPHGDLEDLGVGNLVFTSTYRRVVLDTSTATPDPRSEEVLALWIETDLADEPASPFQLPATPTLVEGQSDVGTLLPTLEGRLSSQLTDLFTAAREEVFEDGVDSTFSLGLGRLIETHGEVAISALQVVLSGERNVEVKVEAVLQLGAIRDLGTHSSRLAVLLRHLSSPDPRIRDAASVGLSDMDDPAAIQGLRNAIARESSPSLRRNFRPVLDQLEATGAATSEG